MSFFLSHTHTPLTLSLARSFRVCVSHDRMHPWDFCSVTHTHLSLFLRVRVSHDRTHSWDYACHTHTPLSLSKCVCASHNRIRTWDFTLPLTQSQIKTKNNFIYFPSHPVIILIILYFTLKSSWLQGQLSASQGHPSLFRSQIHYAQTSNITGVCLP